MDAFLLLILWILFVSAAWLGLSGGWVLQVYKIYILLELDTIFLSKQVHFQVTLYQVMAFDVKSGNIWCIVL